MNFSDKIFYNFKEKIHLNITFLVQIKLNEKGEYRIKTRVTQSDRERSTGKEAYKHTDRWTK